MATELTMPKTGHIEDEATVYQWLKAQGDAVEKGEVVLEVETQKAILEVEAFTSGTLLKILVAEGTIVPVGTPLAIIGDAEETV
jgi:pyruvate/2-oxoglutarate dehydrogenase complex dihydrolipoamide acyltransferase (E2) component